MDHIDCRMGQNSFLKLSAAAPPNNSFHPIRLHENWNFQQILPGAAHVLGVATKVTPAQTPKN